MFGVGTTLKNDIFKNNNQISSTVTTRTCALSTEWTKTRPSIGIQMKKWHWFPYVQMVDVVIQGLWVFHRINKDKHNESLPLLAFWRYVVNVILLQLKESLLIWHDRPILSKNIYSFPLGLFDWLWHCYLIFIAIFVIPCQYIIIIQNCNHGEIVTAW